MSPRQWGSPKPTARRAYRWTSVASSTGTVLQCSRTVGSGGSIVKHKRSEIVGRLLRGVLFALEALALVAVAVLAFGVGVARYGDQISWLAPLWESSQKPLAAWWWKTSRGSTSWPRHIDHAGSSNGAWKWYWAGELPAEGRKGDLCRGRGDRYNRGLLHPQGLTLSRLAGGGFPRRGTWLGERTG